MKIFMTALAAAAIGAHALSAQTFFSLHAGTDGVGVDVTNISPYFPMAVAPPPPPVRHVHVPLMPGYAPDPGYRHYRKAAKEYRKASKHYRKALYEMGAAYALPGIIYGGYDDFDDDDYEEYYRPRRVYHERHYGHHYGKHYNKHQKHHKKHHDRHHGKHHGHH